MSNLPDASGDNESADSLSDLICFSGPFTDSKRARVARTLRQVERALDLPDVPASAGARWAVAAKRDGLASISRLGVRYIFAATSLEVALEKVVAWTQE